MNIPYNIIEPFEPLGIPSLERTLTLAELSKILADHYFDCEYKRGTLIIRIPNDSPFAKYAK